MGDPARKVGAYQLRLESATAKDEQSVVSMSSRRGQKAASTALPVGYACGLSRSHMRPTDANITSSPCAAPNRAVSAVSGAPCALTYLTTRVRSQPLVEIVIASSMARRGRPTTWLQALGAHVEPSTGCV